jgi:MFS family permease
LTTDNREKSVAYLGLIRSNANFRCLWYGQIVSLLGDWFNLIASAALVGSLTQSGFAVGGLFVVRALAPFVASPIAGVVADRYNRRTILLGADLLRGITVFGFLLVRDTSDVWLLYTLTAIQLAISGFFFTTRNAILPDIVPQQAIATANTITSATWSTMLALGAALGGLVAGFFGVYTAFVIDGCTFFLSAMLIAGIHLNRSASSQQQEKTMRAFFADYVTGLRLLVGDRDLLLIALQKTFLMLFFGSTFQVLLVAISETDFMIGERGSLAVGMMFATMGLGTGTSPLLARLYTKDQDLKVRIAILLGYCLAALGLVVTGSLASFEVVLAGTFIVGSGGGLLWVFSTQLLLQRSPHQVRGRIFASEFACFSLATAAGATLAGVALDQKVGIHAILLAMAIVSLAPAVAWALWTWRAKTAQNSDARP